MSGQGELFEPRPAECGSLALGHLQKADRCRRNAAIAEARGWYWTRVEYAQAGAAHEREADELAMLADFYALGGVVS